MASSSTSEYSYDAASRLVPELRRLLNSVAPDQRAAVQTFWNHTRGELRQLEARCRALQASLDAARNQPAPVGIPASRTLTTQSTELRRFNRQTQIDAEFIAQDEGSATVESIWDLDPQWVRAHLDSDRDRREEGGDRRGRLLGCWMTRPSSAHAYGYTKVNLRNTFRPGSTDERIGTQPFRHQLAVVADGYGQNLLRTTGAAAPDEVSHLCLNSRCFNPDHVIVEPKAMNRKRWACGGAWAVRTMDGTVYNPCPHRAEEPWRQCMLPTMELARRQGYYENSAIGPILRG